MGRGLLAGVAVAVAAAGVILYSALFTVKETEQALVLQFGDVRDVIQDAGLHFKTPFVQNVIYLDKRILDLDSKAQEVIVADENKRIVVDAFARYRIVDPRRYYESVNNEVTARSRLSSNLSSEIRDVLGKQTLQAVVRDDRSALMAEIRDNVNDFAQGLGMEIVDVRIKRADLPEQNSQAIYRRMQTERERDAALIRATGNELGQKIRAAADRTVTVTLARAREESEKLRGQGDAERNRIFADAFGIDPEFFAFYRSMQAYTKGLQASGTTLVLRPDSEFFSFFQDSGSSTPPQISSDEVQRLIDELLAVEEVEVPDVDSLVLPDIDLDEIDVQETPEDLDEGTPGTP